MAKKGLTSDDLKRMGYHDAGNGQFVKNKCMQQVDGSLEPFIPKRAYPSSTKREDLLKLMTTGTIQPYGIKQQIDDETVLHLGAKPLMVFDVDPIGAPRMTRSDQWKSDPFHADPDKRQRKPVTQYFRFKDVVVSQAKKVGFTLPESGFHVIFHIRMPHSWSEKKKAVMRGNKHQQKCDWDNLMKALQDALCENDSYIWDCRVTKLWADSGKILIYPIQ